MQPPQLSFLSDDYLAGGRNEVILIHMEGQQGCLKNGYFKDRLRTL